jgi:hypothetical protein
MLDKLVTGTGNRKTIEALAIAPENLLNSFQKQGFPEATGAGQEKVTFSAGKEIIDIICLVGIDTVSINDTVKIRERDREFFHGHGRRSSAFIRLYRRSKAGRSSFRHLEIKAKAT